MRKDLVNLLHNRRGRQCVNTSRPLTNQRKDRIMAASNSTGKHLNFCRQMVKQYKAWLSVPSNADNHNRFQHLIDLSAASQKFILPCGGRILKDYAFRGLEKYEALNLPFPFIALEYQVEKNPITTGQFSSSKRIVFARTDEDFIRLTTVCFKDVDGTWHAFPDVAIPRRGWCKDIGSDGRALCMLMPTQARQFDRPEVYRDYLDECGAVMDFLNALSCSNVEIGKSPAGKTAKAMHKAFPFDDYHILTIKSSTSDGLRNVGSAVGIHRSPREHLRRGHIRRHANGAKIWVNATVVNPGIGGKVSKDYRLAA